MRESHKPLKHTESGWGEFCKDLGETMGKFKVGEGEEKELFAIVESTKGDIGPPPHLYDDSRLQKPPSICRSHLSLHRNVQAGSQQICGVRKFRQNIDHLCLAIELIASTYDPAYVREFTAVREYERDITLLIGLLGGFQEFDALDINVERNLIHYADRVQLSDLRHAAPLASFFRYEGALIDKRTLIMPLMGA